MAATDAADRGPSKRPEFPYGLKLRLKRIGSWFVRSRPAPADWLREREWLAQELGLARIFHRRHLGPGRIRIQYPSFRRDNCQPLVDDRVVPAAEAHHMREDDLVVGALENGEARAYPWWIMDNHHVGNDILGGRALVILVCEVCSTGVGFDAMVDDRRLTFENAHIYNGIIALRDHQTGSVWSPYLAMAIRGRLKGRRLGLLPVWQMEWKLWRERHPDTTVLAGELGSRTGHGSEHNIGDPMIPAEMRATMARWDTRLPHNTLVLGAVTEGGQRVYPLSLLYERGGVINDHIAGTPIVVLALPEKGSYAAAAFSREVDGRLLTFRKEGERFRDIETGSEWSLEGHAETGPLAGAQLRFVGSHVSEWYVWATHFQEMEIAG